MFLVHLNTPIIKHLYFLSVGEQMLEADAFDKCFPHELKASLFISIKQQNHSRSNVLLLGTLLIYLGRKLF